MEKYDVIIIGAGSAGCVLAAHLSEDPQRSILLVEAGNDYPDLTQLPDGLKYGNNQSAALFPPHIWIYMARAAPRRAEPLPIVTGKVAGGSSAVNGQTFLRGIPEDYDSWASLGNDQWSFQKVLPYFRKLERDVDFGGDFHGSQGPIPVRRHQPETWTPVQAALYEACRAAGFPDNPDMNHPQATGTGPVPTNNDDGIRISTALAYLNPSRHRQNLAIRANTLARRVLFDGQRAIGVEVESNGERSRVYGDEIILSAGAIASPQLLMLSGVGPADHLRRLGIPTVQHLPGVGENLKDHPNVSVKLRVKEGFPPDASVPLFQTRLLYTTEGSSARNDMFIAAKSYDAPPEGDRWQGKDGRFAALLLILNFPASIGKLRLISRDPDMQPRLDYRFLTEAWDRKRLREAARLCIDLLDQPAFRSLGVERISPTREELASDRALDIWLLQGAGGFHSSCTCRMGLGSDPLAVTDQYCRVHGLENLRVVDASVMPDLVRAGTNATTIMIAERVADWLSRR